MRMRNAVGLAVLAGGLLTAAGAHAPAFARQPADKAAAPPKFLYGHDLKVRPGGEKDFPKALKVGVEWFQHEIASGEGAAAKPVAFSIGISDKGSISAFPAGAVGADKNCKWVTAHDLKVRKAGEADFTQKTKLWGVEVFNDRGTNHLLYVSEAGAVAFAPVPAGLATEKGPKWHHALELKVRGPDQETFEGAKKIGLEVFKDENTGGLMYITETGSIATVAAPAAAPDPKKIAAPKPLYGLVLRARKGDETEFTGTTKKIGVEVFEDPNAGTLVYVTELGTVAVVPYAGKLTDAKGVAWKGAMNLRVRQAGEKDFDKAAKYGVEAFQDRRTGNLVLIAETGAIAVLPQ